jgi:hypothetical protein
MKALVLGALQMDRRGVDQQHGTNRIRADFQLNAALAIAGRCLSVDQPR